MFDNSHYVPLLKWKRGEYRAVQQLDPAVKAGLTPLFELPPMEYSPAAGSTDPAFDARLMRIPGEVEQAWGTEHRAFFDLILLDEAARYNGTIHPVRYFFEACQSRGIQAVPVTGLDRNPDYQNAVAAAVETSGAGACMRIDLEQYNEPGFGQAIDDLLAELNTTPEDVDLVFDMGSILGIQPTLLATTIVTALNHFPHLHEWRSLTLASGAYPQGVSHFPVGRHLLPRLDWDLWRQVSVSAPARLPTFGDYGIVHPEIPDLDMSVINVSATARYTVDDYWIVHRGRGVRTRGSGGFAQFINHARALSSDPLFAGASFSAGDQAIVDIASGSTNCGNPETWIRIGTNHHLTFVVRHLASLGAS